MHGHPFFYFAYAAAVSEVVIDTLTGEWKLLQADLLYDAGEPEPGAGHRPGRRRLHPGHGLADHRGTVVEQGRQADDACSLHLQDPGHLDCPEAFRTELYANSNVSDTIHRSKAVGEPPLLLPFSVFLAIRDAVSSVGGHRVNPPLRAPATSEAILDAVDAVRGYAHPVMRGGETS
jgi:xanthine dehydrogenase large subunit